MNAATTTEPLTCDLLIVGGGVNGAGIARDAAGRGLSVVLCDKGDLGGATSSASSKLIHGGLRYLEQSAFRLVRESLIERETLLASAPHIIRPLRFVLPHHRGLRPAWMLRAGLFIYDHLSGNRTLPGTRTVDLGTDPVGEPLAPSLTRGFEYSDCWVDDARLVVLLALDASERGARILPRSKFVEARREGAGAAAAWSARVQLPHGDIVTVTARALINAGGPWVSEVAQRIGLDRRGESVRLVKGSHIVVPRLYEGPQCYTLQAGDGRVVFAIPYEQEFTLVGTTDVQYHNDPLHAAITQAETEYLCQTIGEYFGRAPAPADVVWSYAGVRPLHDDGSAKASSVSRDYLLDLNSAGGQAPALSIYGGKITTFRRLAEHALRDLARVLPGVGPAWTGDAKIPGGDLGTPDFESFFQQMSAVHRWLPPDLLHRWCRAYGTRVTRVIGDATCMMDLGQAFGAGLHAREVAYLRDQEWASEPEDVLWRRTKLGLHMTEAQRQSFARSFVHAFAGA